MRASHIKPWSRANDEERLDSFNGLLLAACSSLRRCLRSRIDYFRGVGEVGHQCDAEC
ncbi:hypothetical protein [Pseudomonas viridiflava]|uniref:hypothetical protein n=1 Tax=Pseudomonas viridiflava TaxID=33069 RepID=UPI003BAD0110